MTIPAKPLAHISGCTKSIGIDARANGSFLVVTGVYCWEVKTWHNFWSMYEPANTNSAQLDIFVNIQILAFPNFPEYPEKVRKMAQSLCKWLTYGSLEKRTLHSVILSAGTSNRKISKYGQCPVWPLLSEPAHIKNTWWRKSPVFFFFSSFWVKKHNENKMICFELK